MALVINGQKIDPAVLQFEFSEIKTYFERLGNVSCCERDEEFRGYARQNVTARVLLSQEAKRRYEPTPEAELDAAIAGLIKQYGGEVQFYAATGARPDAMHLVRNDVDADMRVKRLMDDLVGDVSILEEDLRNYYEANIDQFKSAEEVRASHILKAPKRVEERDAAFETLRACRRELLKGADFEDLARKHSDKAEEHIDLGFFKRGELTEEFELVAFSMEIGEISPIFCSSFGFHLIKLTDRKPAAPKPFDSVRDEVRQLMKENIRQERARKFVEELTAVATIEQTPEEVEELVT